MIVGPAPIGTTITSSQGEILSVTSGYYWRAMANIKSQIKRNKTNERARLRNKAVKAELRTRIKSAVTSASEGAPDTEANLRLAIKRLDKAATKGIIHRNQAANRKSRLMKRIAAASSNQA